MTVHDALRLVPGHRPPKRPDTTGVEPVDLDDAEAVRRAIALHQAGKAVFSVPFNSIGDGTLRWLDPREMDAGAGR